MENGKRKAGRQNCCLEDSMSRGYTKLFSSIVTSSMWCEDSDTRIVWVTMLALADQYGEVQAAVPGLARTSNVSLEKCVTALKLFSEPDVFSRTKDNEGRRIVEIEGGWKLLNYEQYREKMSLDDRREYKRVKEAERRDRLKSGVDNSVDTRGQNQADTDFRLQITDTDYKEVQTTQGKPAKKGEGFEVPEILKTNVDFMKAWESWLQHLKEKKKGGTPTALKFQLALCVKWGAAYAIECIELSITKNWQSIYEPKGNSQTKPTSETRQGRPEGIKGKKLQ
jgi:hypothetical protein